MNLQNYVQQQAQGEGACLANSISWMLGLPKDSVPNFTAASSFWMSVDSYLFSWGLCIKSYNGQSVKHILHIGFNQSKVSHCVVCDKSEKMLYDSYPSGGELKKDITKWVIVPLSNKGDISG